MAFFKAVLARLVFLLSRLFWYLFGSCNYLELTSYLDLKEESKTAYGLCLAKKELRSKMLMVDSFDLFLSYFNENLFSFFSLFSEFV